MREGLWLGSWSDKIVTSGLLTNFLWWATKQKDRAKAVFQADGQAKRNAALLSFRR
jgi:hypothetical protein